MKHQMRGSTHAQQAMTLWITLMSSSVFFIFFFGGEESQFCDVAKLAMIHKKV